MRSPETMGEACARPGSGVCQRTFWPVATSHAVGSGLLASTPQACGPRYWGQSAAWLSATASTDRTAVTEKSRKRLGFMGSSDKNTDALAHRRPANTNAPKRTHFVLAREAGRSRMEFPAQCS